MDWDAIGAVGEIIGALAVVVSIGYLAFQIRQNTRSLDINAEIAMSHEFADWASMAIDNPRLGEIWDTAVGDPKALNEEDSRLFIWYIAKILLLLEGQFNLFQAGHITKATWDTKMTFLLGILKISIIAQWWDAKVAPFSPTYFNYVNDRRNSPEYQWQIKQVISAGEESI